MIPGSTSHRHDEASGRLKPRLREPSPVPRLACDKILRLIDVQLQAFSPCVIEENGALDCPPADATLFHFVIEGEGTLECEHGRYPLKPGNVIIVPKDLAKRLEGPGGPHSVTGCDESAMLARRAGKIVTPREGSSDLLLGTGAVFVGLGGAMDLFGHLDRPLVETEGGSLPLLGTAMAEELRHPSAGSNAMIAALARLVILVVLRGQLARKDGCSPLSLIMRNPQLCGAIMAIVGRPGAPHSIDSLSRAAGMSRSGFNRQFTASYGCSPMDFVQSVRLRAAARMLTGSELPVKSIASRVGYSSRSHFSRAFTAHFGIDPTGYRSCDSGISRPGQADREEQLGLGRAQVENVGHRACAFGTVELDDHVDHRGRISERVAARQAQSRLHHHKSKLLERA